MLYLFQGDDQKGSAFLFSLPWDLGLVNKFVSNTHLTCYSMILITLEEEVNRFLFCTISVLDWTKRLLRGFPQLARYNLLLYRFLFFDIRAEINVKQIIFYFSFPSK